MAPSWDYQHSYPGGKMVAAPGFPRELTPPDGATLSGPDAEAYKRTVWRAGRWTGPASGFDREYSRAFALGKEGGNVGDSGIAGVQRQQKMEPTGIVDKETFNLLRSIRIPQGLPNAGQAAMDANAQNLIAEAWQLYGQKPPPKTTRQRALEGATSWIGYAESPPGSNSTIFGRAYGVDFQPWCAMFASYCFEVEAGGSPSFNLGSRYAYVPYIVDDADARRNGLSTTSSPVPGDLVCYDWQRDGTFDHVGIFEGWASLSSFTAIEGNTSTTDNSNGGQVMRRGRDIASANVVFVRVA